MIEMIDWQKDCHRNLWELSAYTHRRPAKRVPAAPGESFGFQPGLVAPPPCEARLLTRETENDAEARREHGCRLQRHEAGDAGHERGQRPRPADGGAVLQDAKGHGQPHCGLDGRGSVGVSGRDRESAHCSLYDEGFTRIGCIGCPLAGARKQNQWLDRYPKYKALYLKTFARMLKERERKERETEKWKTAEDVMKWWTGAADKEGKKEEDGEH